MIIVYFIQMLNAFYKLHVNTDGIIYYFEVLILLREGLDVGKRHLYCRGGPFGAPKDTTGLPHGLFIRQ